MFLFDAVTLTQLAELPKPHILGFDPAHPTQVSLSSHSPDALLGGAVRFPDLVALAIAPAPRTYAQVGYSQRGAQLAQAGQAYQGQSGQPFMGQSGQPFLGQSGQSYSGQSGQVLLGQVYPGQAGQAYQGQAGQPQEAPVEGEGILLVSVLYNDHSLYVWAVEQLAPIDVHLESLQAPDTLFKFRKCSASSFHSRCIWFADVCFHFILYSSFIMHLPEIELDLFSRSHLSHFQSTQFVITFE